MPPFQLSAVRCLAHHECSETGGKFSTAAIFTVLREVICGINPDSLRNIAGTYLALHVCLFEEPASEAVGAPILRIGRARQSDAANSIPSFRRASTGSRNPRDRATPGLPPFCDELT